MAEFCDHDDRLLGVAMVPLDDPVRALAGIAEADALGLVAVWIASDAPRGRSPGHVEHEPIWAMLAERGLPFILHVGSSPLTVADAWLNDGRPNRATARGGETSRSATTLPVRRCPAVPTRAALMSQSAVRNKLDDSIGEVFSDWFTGEE